MTSEIWNVIADCRRDALIANAWTAEYEHAPIHEEVARLEVAVQHVRAVDVLEAAQDLQGSEGCDREQQQRRAR